MAKVYRCLSVCFHMRVRAYVRTSASLCVCMWVSVCVCFSVCLSYRFTYRCHFGNWGRNIKPENEAEGRIVCVCVCGCVCVCVRARANRCINTLHSNLSWNLMEQFYTEESTLYWHKIDLSVDLYKKTTYRMFYVYIVLWLR